MTQPSGSNELADIEQTLVIAKASADQDRPAFIDHALVYVDRVKGDLFTSNPDNEFRRVGRRGSPGQCFWLVIPQFTIMK